MPQATTRRDLIATLPGVAVLLATEPAAGRAPPTAAPPRPAFQAAQRAWHRAWQRYRAQDQRAAACGFDATEPGRAALARMDALLVLIDRIETALARTPARTRAELRIKIEVLSLDGMIRPEFLDDIIADVEHMLLT
ncbi:hypothetical protein ACEPPZ_15380 [Paracoccus yeei]|uniref:hypothetical protein n=1 Tax=Paracoccus yeei TaxID=147645 RepID=UPI0037D67E1F